MSRYELVSWSYTLISLFRGEIHSRVNCPFVFFSICAFCLFIYYHRFVCTVFQKFIWIKMSRKKQYIFSKLFLKTIMIVQKLFFLGNGKLEDIALGKEIFFFLVLSFFFFWVLHVILTKPVMSYRTQPNLLSFDAANNLNAHLVVIFI